MFRPFVWGKAHQVGYLSWQAGWDFWLVGVVLFGLFVGIGWRKHRVHSPEEAK